MNTSPTIEMMGYTASKPAFAGFPQSAQADLVFPIAHDFNRGADVWTRYPCGVACGAGELVEQQKPLDGGSWTTSALYLQGILLVRRNSEWHHFDPLGTAGVITNSSASVISNNLYDLFGVKRYEQGSAETPWRWKGYRSSEEGMLFRTGSLVVIQGLGAIVLGVGIVVVAVVSCAAIADDVRDEVSEWNDETPQWPDKDKLLHCVATCLINLRAGIPCALVAAYSTERGGGGVQDPRDEQANLDGFWCAQKIKWDRNGNPLDFSLLNDWQQCQWCCRQKGYRPQ